MVIEFISFISYKYVLESFDFLGLCPCQVNFQVFCMNWWRISVVISLIPVASVVMPPFCFQYWLFVTSSLFFNSSCHRLVCHIHFFRELIFGFVDLLCHSCPVLQSKLPYILLTNGNHFICSQFSGSTIWKDLSWGILSLYHMVLCGTDMEGLKWHVWGLGTGMSLCFSTWLSYKDSWASVPGDSGPQMSKKRSHRTSSCLGPRVTAADSIGQSGFRVSLDTRGRK